MWLKRPTSCCKNLFRTVPSLSYIRCIPFIRYNWATPSPLDVIHLLDHRFQDARVRAYAVNTLTTANDRQLVNVLFQLCYLLRFEPHIDSSLMRFVLRRAVGNPAVVGRLLCIHILNAFCEDPPANANYNWLLTVLLRALPDVDRVRITNGLFIFQTLGDIFPQCYAEYVTASATSTQTATSGNSVFSSLGGRRPAADKMKQPKSAVDSTIEKMLAVPIPKEFYTPLSARLCISVEKYLALTEDSRKKSLAVNFSLDKPKSRADKLRVIYR